MTDVNDHVPEFPKRKIQHSIAESMDPESSGIPIPAAVDNDSGKNAIRTYELKSKVDKFELIQRQTADGATDLRLVLKDKLDREIKDE